MTDRESSELFDFSKLKEWSRWDWLGVVAVGLLLAPPIGLLIALVWLAYETFLVLRAMAGAVRDEIRDTCNRFARTRRALVRRAREWFATDRTPEVPPPPTREQTAAEARRRYEQRLRLLAAAKLEPTELEAARAQARTQYLREIDEAMK